jgi:hypothetical protein
MSLSTSGTLECWKVFNSVTAQRATFSFNFGSYLKTKFDTHPFVDNQMVDLKNEPTQYESTNEGSGSARGSNLYKSPSPLHPLCAKRQ